MLAFEFGAAAVEALGEGRGDTTGVLGVQALIAAGGLLKRQLLGAGIPEVDLLDQPCLDLALDFRDLGDALGTDLVEMVRHEMLDRKRDGAAFDIVCQPALA
jgi:hypothetical protein